MFPLTLEDAARFFSSQADGWRKTWRKYRWPDGLRCPHCGSQRIANDVCRDCRSRISEKAGTLMQDSRCSFEAWMIAFWAESRSSYSYFASAKLGRAAGVSQDAACRMQRVIWYAKKTPTFQKLCLFLSRNHEEAFHAMVHALAQVPRNEVDEELAKREVKPRSKVFSEFLKFCRERRAERKAERQAAWERNRSIWLDFSLNRSRHGSGGARSFIGSR